MEKTTLTVAENGQGPYTQEVKAARHTLLADEPEGMGGRDLGPAPYELLLASLGACTSMTLRMYADRKKWDLRKVSVTLTHQKETGADGQKQDVFTRSISVEGSLDGEQRQRLLEIANKCPVHRTLMEDPRPKLISTLTA